MTQKFFLQGPRWLCCGGLRSKVPEGDCHTSGIGRQVRCFCFASLTCPALHQVESWVPQWWIYHLDGGRSWCKYVEWSCRVIVARACLTMARRPSVWPMDQATSRWFCTFSVPPLSLTFWWPKTLSSSTSICHMLNLDQLWGLTCKLSLQHVLGHVNFKQMDRAAFQACLEDRILDNLVEIILEFTAGSVHKCVCQNEMCLNWLASVWMETQIQVSSSVTAMKILLL